MGAECYASQWSQCSPMLSRAPQVCHSIWKIPQAAKASPIGYSSFGLTHIPMTSTRTPAEVSFINPSNIIKSVGAENVTQRQRTHVADTQPQHRKNNKRFNEYRKVAQSVSHLAITRTQTQVLEPIWKKTKHVLWHLFLIPPLGLGGGQKQADPQSSMTIQPSYLTTSRLVRTYLKTKPKVMFSKE